MKSFESMCQLDELYNKDRDPYGRYTQQFRKAMFRFRAIKKRLNDADELFGGWFDVRWPHLYKKAMKEEDWAMCKMLARGLRNALARNIHAFRPFHRSLKLKWAKNIRTFTRKSGKWWCVG